MKPRKNQFVEHDYGNVLPTEMIEKYKPWTKLTGSEVDKDAKAIADEAKTPPKNIRVQGVTRSKAAKAILLRQGKLLSVLGRGVRGKHDKEATKVAKENSRELWTAVAARGKTSISSLTKRAAEGNPTEISGDALARAKRGDAPKLITSTSVWEKHKKDLGVE